MSYSIGLDIGITSVGYAVIELDSNDEPRRIIRLGSRIFDKAENPKDGASLAKPRREARSARRRLRRHRHRLERIRQLIVSANILDESTLLHLYDKAVSDIYQLRTEALDRKVTNEEFARILINLAQRRGFKSNRKNDNEDKDLGKLLTAIKENENAMLEHQYRTIGEMMFKDERFTLYKRNKSESYLNTVSRTMVQDEIRLIFEAQRKAENSFASVEIEKQYTDIVMSQRSFDDGPGGNSPYGGNQIERMVGKCAFEEEPRAPKASYSFEYFSLLQKTNHMRIVTSKTSRSLTSEERNMLVDLAHDVADLKYARIRKELRLKPEELFADLSYGNKSTEEVEKASFRCLASYHIMRKALDKVSKGRINYYSKEMRNAVAYAFTVFKSEEKLKEKLNSLGLEAEDIDVLMTISGFSKFSHLSVKACDKLIPFLEQGLVYNEACMAAGYNFKGHSNGDRFKFLPTLVDEFEDITNPVVRRAISQTIKVINAIIREQGESPVMVNIELAREMSKDFAERKKLEKEMKENEAKNDRLMDRIRNEFCKTNPTGMDLVKLKLWEEQGGICPYSLTPLDVTKIFDAGYADIDHVIPYSISFDDSYKNKVLVKSAENRQKGNRIPLQYIAPDKREQYIVWVNNTVRDKRKRMIMLKESLTAEDLEGFKERNLQDTKYISRFMCNFINDYLEFSPSHTARKKKVTSVNGAVTSYMRKRWGISKVREDGDLHHAVDAAVVACITDGIIKRVSYYCNHKEIEYVQTQEESLVVNRNTGEVLQQFPPPWPNFSKEIKIRLSENPAKLLCEAPLPNYADIDLADIKPVFVSRMPKHKVTGAAHKDTVKSPKALSEGIAILKRPLTALKLDESGEIPGYYMPQSDLLLYNALKRKLFEYGNNAEKAFSEPFYKPKSNGERGPLVKKVKMCEKTTLNVALHNGNGIADNDSMVRIDVFFVAGKGYFFVPIYIADTLKDMLPNKAVKAGKDYSQWEEMVNEDFIFSLYPNDLIRVTSKKDIVLSLLNKESSLDKNLSGNSLMLYYISADIATASIGAVNHDKSYFIRGLGIKTLESIEKYQVDVLGNYYRIGNEKRQYFR